MRDETKRYVLLPHDICSVLPPLSETGDSLSGWNMYRASLSGQTISHSRFGLSLNKNIKGFKLQSFFLLPYFRVWTYHSFCYLQGAMERFTSKIVSMMKAENLFESQGGPIILSQVRQFSRFIVNFPKTMLSVTTPYYFCNYFFRPESILAFPDMNNLNR